MGERRPYTPEVVGSIPAPPTHNLTKDPLCSLIHYSGRIKKASRLLTDTPNPSTHAFFTPKLYKNSG